MEMEPMRLPDIVIHEPETVAEACDLLNEYCPNARVLAGGTDLLVDLKQGRIKGVERLVSLKRIAGLDSVDDTNGTIRIGALVTLNEACRAPIIKQRFPALIDALESMAAYPVRSVATVAGNIAGAVPSSDLAPFFIVAGAEAVLSSGDRERAVRVEDYFLGPRESVCGDCEILTHLVVPKPGRSTGMSYKKFMLREANALAVAGVAAMLALEGGSAGKILESRIALTAVAPKPVIAREAAARLKGKAPSKEVFGEAARVARQEARPITDIRGTDEYRADLVEVLTARALSEALRRAGSGGA
jgi:carbon-monoxide dehydrogenase medium subunit